MESKKFAKKKKMQDIFIHIDNVFRHVERKFNDPIDHSVLQTYSKLKS